MKVGIDLDGVCYDFVAALRTWLTSKGRDPRGLPEANCWDFFRDQWGMTTAEFIAECAEGVDAGVIFREGDPMPQARWALQALHGMGHTVHIVTDRSFGRRSQENTAAWLAEHGIRFDSLTFSADKTIVRTDAFVDDKPANVEALRKAGVRAFLFDRPHNQEARHLRRVATLADFVREVELMSEEEPESILLEAQRLVHGARGADYGHPAEDFARTGRMWGAILGTADVPPDRVGLCMAAVKISREVNAHKRDNLTDLAGYAETVSMVHDWEG